MKVLVGIVFCFVVLNLFGQWTSVTPPPSNFRTDHSFGFGLNGKGYLVAGYNDVESDFSDDFYRYDPTTDQWTQLTDFPGDERGFAIGDIYNNKAYFGFGRGGANDEDKDDLWVFNPNTEQWTELSSFPGLARIHPAFVINQGIIYVGLGSNQTVGNLDDWWSYNIATDTWNQLTDFPSFPRHHPYQFATGGFVYVGFGHGNFGTQIYKEWYRYTPGTDTWTQVADIPGEARVAGTQFSLNGYGYILSGDGADHTSMDIGEFWRYDGNTDSWEQLPSHPGQSRWAPASFIISDEVYLINGANTPAYTYPNSAWKFNLADLPVGIKEEKEADITISPNPFENEITLDFSSYENTATIKVEMINLLGKVVYEKNLESTDKKLDLNTIEKGVYIFNIKQNDVLIKSEKLVKSR